MYNIIKYCVANNIKLTQSQRRARLSTAVRRVYSSYPTLEGHMFYAKGGRGDVFIHLMKDGKIELANGWDGGDLRNLPQVKSYYGEGNGQG